MPTDDKFDQRLEDLRKKITRSGDQAGIRACVKATSSRPNRSIWLLVLFTFLAVFLHMWSRMPLDPVASAIMAALVAAIVLFLTQLVISLLTVNRKEA